MIIPVFSIPKIRQQTTQARQLRLLWGSTLPPVFPKQEMEPLKIIYSGRSLPDWVPLKNVPLKNGTKDVVFDRVWVYNIPSVEVTINPSQMTPLWWKRSFGVQPLRLPSTSSLFGNTETFVVPNPKIVGIPQSWRIDVKKSLEWAENVDDHREISREIVLVASGDEDLQGWEGSRFIITIEVIGHVIVSHRIE